ncbi:molybdenum cofactor guanylyltransferase [Microbacterium marinilacus]|uniref:MobA-like NTP transferase domain-containing protein n=1 Tax=Microbacterium marinilacus TaxID=415209 RepID=A0ABP7BQC2_9MICO|nr:molybdenum cofactor guanylyltransferase [Microbacterium marinilacus]MBY0689834.1 molybdenum cofactor guanylyltransferase [Microbacterium marinilacus]
MGEGGVLRGIVLAGGRASRLGGLHKPGIPIAGEPMVARVVGALRQVGAEPLVVGEHEGVPDGVPVVREDPPYSGPVSAVSAGMRALPPRSGTVLLLGGDMPFVTAAALRSLLRARTGPVALAVDGSGRDQPLCAAWEEEALRERLAAIGDPRDRPLRALLQGEERIVRLPLPDEVLFDVDTPDDLQAARGDEP